MATRLEQIAVLVKPVVESLGFQYWGLVSQAQGGREVLRIFIESDAGITVDDCARVSRQISSILDVEGPMKAAYVLEVSSPGMDRLLFTKEQFARYIDQELMIKLYQSMDGRRSFKGTLKKIIDDEQIELEVSGQCYSLLFNNIQTAQVCIAQDQYFSRGKNHESHENRER